MTEPFDPKRGFLISDTPEDTQEILNQVDICDADDCADDGTSTDGTITKEEIDIYGADKLQAELAKIGYQADFQHNKIFALSSPTKSKDKEIAFTKNDFSVMPQDLWDVLAGGEAVNSGLQDDWKDSLFADGMMEELGWYDDKLVLPNLALIDGNNDSKSEVLRQKLQQRLIDRLSPSVTDDNQKKYLYYFPQIEKACSVIAEKMGFIYIVAKPEQQPQFEFCIDVAELESPRSYKGHEGILAIETNTKKVFFLRTSPTTRAALALNGKMIPAIFPGDPKQISVNLPRSFFDTAKKIDTLYNEDTLPKDEFGKTIYPPNEYLFEGKDGNSLTLASLPITIQDYRGYDPNAEKPLHVFSTPFGPFAIYTSDLTGIVERATLVTLLAGAAMNGPKPGTAAPPVAMPASSMELSALEGRVAEEELSVIRLAGNPGNTANGDVTRIDPSIRGAPIPDPNAPISANQPPLPSQRTSLPMAASSTSSSTSGGLQTNTSTTPRVIPGAGAKPPPLPAQRAPTPSTMSDTISGRMLTPAEIAELTAAEASAASRPAAPVTVATSPAPAAPPIVPPSAPTPGGPALPQIMPSALPPDAMTLPAIIFQIVRAPGIDQSPADLPGHEKVDGVVGDKPVVTTEDIIEQIRRDPDLGTAVDEAYTKWQQAVAEGNVTEAAKWHDKLNGLVAGAQTRVTAEKGALAATPGKKKPTTAPSVPSYWLPEPTEGGPLDQVSRRHDVYFPEPAPGYLSIYYDQTEELNAAWAGLVSIDENTPRTEVVSRIERYKAAFDAAYPSAMAVRTKEGTDAGQSFGEDYGFTVARAGANGQIDVIDFITFRFDLKSLNASVGSKLADAVRHVLFLGVREWIKGGAPNYASFYGRAVGQTSIVNFSMIQSQTTQNPDIDLNEKLHGFLEHLPSIVRDILTQLRKKHTELTKQLIKTNDEDLKKRLQSEIAKLNQILDYIRVNGNVIQIQNNGHGWQNLDSFFKTVDYSITPIPIQTSVVETDDGMLGGAVSVADVESTVLAARDKGVRAIELKTNGVEKPLLPNGALVDHQNVFDALCQTAFDSLSDKPQSQLRTGFDLTELARRTAWRMLRDRNLSSDTRLKKADELATTWVSAIIEAVTDNSDDENGYVMPIYEFASRDAKSFVAAVQASFWDPMDKLTLEVYRMAGGLSSLSREARIAGDREGSLSFAITAAQTRLSESSSATLSAEELDDLRSNLLPNASRALNWINQTDLDPRDGGTVVKELFARKTLADALAANLALVQSGKISPDQASLSLTGIEFAHASDYNNLLFDKPIDPYPGTEDEVRVRALDPMVRIRVFPVKMSDKEKAAAITPLKATMKGDEGVIAVMGYDNNGELVTPERIFAIGHDAFARDPYYRDQIPQITEKTPNAPDSGLTSTGTSLDSIRLPLWQVVLQDGSSIVVASEKDPSQENVTGFVHGKLNRDLNPEQTGIREFTTDQVRSAVPVAGYLELRLCVLSVSLSSLVSFGNYLASLDPNSPEYKRALAAYKDAYEAKVQDIEAASAEVMRYDNEIKGRSDATTKAHVVPWPPEVHQ